MFENIENLKLVSVLRRSNKPFVRVDNRKMHTLFFRIRGSVLCDFGNKALFAREGTLIFIPKGASYTAKTLSEDCVYLGLHFEGDFAVEPQPCCYSLESFYEADYMESCLSDLWNLGTQAEKYQCWALFYSLLAYLANTERGDSLHKTRFKLIDPAVDYLRQHIYDGDLKIDKLHRLCGISGTYFRQIFSQRFGTTPQKHIQAKRLAHAKAIISSGDYRTLSEVALSVGFRDPLYFSKAFRKTYGMAPSELDNE